MKLSKRLGMIGESIENINVMADIGTDHGALPIMLVKSGRCHRAIASDINKGPIDIVTKRVGLARMADRIEIRKGNGLQILSPGEADLIVIAGMGGQLISDILGASLDVCVRQDVKLVLQPNTEPGLVRGFLLEHEFTITKENLVFDQGKFYEIIWAEYGNKSMGYPGDYNGLIGGYIVEAKHPQAIPYLEKKLLEAEDVFAYLEAEMGRETLEDKSNVTERIEQIKARIDQIKDLIKGLSR